eukprot:1157242-Pelagomonas_calceolata.AAC.5
MHRDDMQKVAPLWLSTTEEVREDPEIKLVKVVNQFLSYVQGKEGWECRQGQQGRYLAANTERGARKPRSVNFCLHYIPALLPSMLTYDDVSVQKLFHPVSSASC